MRVHVAMTEMFSESLPTIFKIARLTTVELKVIKNKITHSAKIISRTRNLNIYGY